MARYTRGACKQVAGPNAKRQKLNAEAAPGAVPLPIVQDAIEPEIDAVEENIVEDVRDTPEAPINRPAFTDEVLRAMVMCHKVMGQVYLKLAHGNPEPIKEFAKDRVADMETLSKNLKTLPSVVSQGPKKFAEETELDVGVILHEISSMQHKFFVENFGSFGRAQGLELIKLFEEAIERLEKIWGSVEEMEVKPEPPQPKTVDRPSTDPQPPINRQPIVDDDME